MINHARTLLLNVNSATHMPGTLGEEYVPPYTAIKLPAFLQLPYKIIFGTNPDRVFLNYRAAEIMRLLHQTELAEFVYALDPRVTYWPQQTTEFFRPSTQITSTKIFGVYETQLNILGRPQSNNRTGRCYSQYTVTITGFVNDETVTIVEDSTPGKIEAPLTWLQNTPTLNIMRLQAGEVGTRGLSEPIPLSDVLLNVQFADIGDPTPKLLLETAEQILSEDYTGLPFELEDGTDAPVVEALRRMDILERPLLAIWRFTAYAKPDNVITNCLPRLEFLGEPFYLELFGVRSDIEPYATFKNIWAEHPNSVYRFAAFLLAMVYRIEELRVKTDA